MKKRGGFSLALTLWIVAILSLLSILYLNYGRAVVLKSRQLEKKLKVVIENESTIELLKFYGATGKFLENRIENTLLKSILKDLPIQIYLNARKIRWKHSIITFQDSSGLIDIDDYSMIAHCLAKDPEQEWIIHDSLMDWKDWDSLSHLNGAEDDYYHQEGKKYSARNELYLAAPEELFLVRGLEQLSKREQKKVLSNVIISDVISYNILTLKDEILQCRYHLTDNDMEQLRKINREDVSSFVSFFYALNRHKMDMETDRMYPSHIVQIEVVTQIDEVQKKTKLLISFKSSVNRGKSFEVLTYLN